MMLTSQLKFFLSFCNFKIKFINDGNVRFKNFIGNTCLISELPLEGSEEGVKKMCQGHQIVNMTNSVHIS